MSTQVCGVHAAVLLRQREVREDAGADAASVSSSCVDGVITRGYHTGRPQALNVLRVEEVRLHGKKGEKATHQGLHAFAITRRRDVAGHHRFKYGTKTVVPRLEGERRQADETEK